MSDNTTIYCPRRLLDVSPKSGWQDDGLYLVQIDDRRGSLVLDNIKVRTKKGEIRFEPVGIMRYSREGSTRVWKVRFLAWEAQS